MKNAVWTVLAGIALLNLTACTDNPNRFAHSTDDVRKRAPVVVSSDGERALKFLTGAQIGNKALMYEATNLTEELVADNREKLIHPKEYKQTDEQRKASENILRVSGEIEYFTGSLRKLFPKSASFQLVQARSLASTAGAAQVDYTIMITYQEREEALRDKSGKLVKSMTIHLFQASSQFNGRVIHSFSFDTKGFDQFADRNFDVVSYY